MDFILILSSASLALVVLNALTIRVVKNECRDTDESVSVLIPMRNEEKNAKDCIKNLLNQKGIKNLDISPYPKQIVIGFIQRVFQPLLQWSWMASVPLLISQKFSIKSMAVANGQFLIVKRNAYLKSGGHESIKGEVLDDLMLARKLLEHGFKGGVAEASQVAQCKMYDSTRDLFLGYQKSLHKAFGSVIGAVFAVALLVATGIVPILGALSGSTLALVSFLLVFASRFISSVRTGGIPNTALLHPIAIIFLIILIIYSWYGKLTKTLSWRGREILNG